MRNRFITAVTLCALALVGTRVTAQQASSENPAYVGGVATQDEDAALKALLNDAYGTLRSDLFRSNMKSLADLHPTIFLRVDGDGGTASPVKYASIDDLVNITQAKPPYRYVRVPVALVGGDRYFFALSGTVGDNTNASFTLGRGNLSNWLSPDMVMQSCAINTVAHESSHLISSDAVSFRLNTQPIKDENAATRSGTNAVASYLIGAVAQCTWLQQKNYSPAVDLKACVKVFGHRGFNSGRCNQFGQVREIKYRSDLYPDHIIIDR